jgi:hypothetical protein
MPRWTNAQNDWNDDPESNEEIDDDGPAEEDEEPTISCPYCGREILEDSERCPHCEHYISQEDAPPARKPWWIILGVAACLYVIYRWTILR